jgi:hypothetical protein
MPGDETVFVTVLLDQTPAERAASAPPTFKETSLERVLPVEAGDADGPTASPAASSADDDALLFQQLLEDDRVPPVVREQLLGLPQQRFIIGDVKTLLLLESAITKALKASVTEDSEHRKQLLRFCKVMASFGIMHGELHLFFHCLQAVFQLWFGLLLQPAASLLRRTGIEPKKGPIDKFAYHLNHLEQTVASVITVMYFRAAEQQGLPLGLVSVGGELDAQVLKGWVDGYTRELETDVDKAVFEEFLSAAMEFLTAYPAGRGHVTTFVDVITKDFLPMFKLLSKGGYVWASMRSTEQTELQLSPYLRMLWSLQRTFGKRNLGAYLDEHVEDLNWWVKLLATTREQMIRYGRLASRVQATTRSFELMKRGGGGDPGHRVGSRHIDHNELVHWLMSAGIGNLSATADKTCKAFGPVIRTIANPPADMALLLGLPGSFAVVDGDSHRKAIVVRAEHDHEGASRHSMAVVLEYLDTNEVCKITSASIDVSVARDAAASALRSAEKATRAEQDEVDRLRDIADEIDKLAGTVEVKYDHGGRVVACNRGEVPFINSSLTSDWIADRKAPTIVERSNHIAHYFAGAECGWYIGTVRSVAAYGTLYWGYTGSRSEYPHRLESGTYNVLWVVVRPKALAPSATATTPAGATAAPVEQLKFVVTEASDVLGTRVLDLTLHLRIGVVSKDSEGDALSRAQRPTTISNGAVQRVMAQRDVADAGRRGRAAMKQHEIHPHAHDAMAAGIRRLSGVGSSSGKTEVGNRLAYHEERQSLFMEVASIHAEGDKVAVAEGGDEHEGGDLTAALATAVDAEVRLENRDLRLARRLAREIEDLSEGVPGSTMTQEERIGAMADKVELLLQIEERAARRAENRLAAVHGGEEM